MSQFFYVQGIFYTFRQVFVLYKYGENRNLNPPPLPLTPRPRLVVIILMKIIVVFPGSFPKWLHLLEPCLFHGFVMVLYHGSTPMIHENLWSNLEIRSSLWFILDNQGGFRLVEWEDSFTPNSYGSLFTSLNHYITIPQFDRTGGKLAVISKFYGLQLHTMVRNTAL